jgi:hypothetical protein
MGQGRVLETKLHNTPRSTKHEGQYRPTRWFIDGYCRGLLLATAIPLRSQLGIEAPYSAIAQGQDQRDARRG